MAIQREIWQDHIVGNLFKNNDFLLRSVNASQYVLQGKVVHIPQAGAVPNIEINRSSLPASVTTRTDTDITYELKAATSDPILIPNADTIELSYDKRESVLGEHQSTLRQAVADYMLVNWAPAVNIIRTTGDAVNSHLTEDGGTRKLFRLKDLKNAQKTLDKQNVPMEDRFALMSADMFQQFTDELEATNYKDFSAAYNAKDGVLGRMYGFNIMMRSSALIYNNAGTPVVSAYNAEVEDADNDGVLCWQMNAVERALGEVKFFERTDDPTYYGDLYSFLLRFGGRKRRSDEKGIVAIVQAHA